MYTRRLEQKSRRTNDDFTRANEEQKKKITQPNEFNRYSTGEMHSRVVCYEAGIQIFVNRRRWLVNNRGDVFPRKRVADRNLSLRKRQ